MKLVVCLLAVSVIAAVAAPVDASRKPDEPRSKPAVKLEFRIATEKPRTNTVKMSLTNGNKKTYHVDAKPFLTGSAVMEARVEQDDFGAYGIGISFDPQGAALMKKMTGENIGKGIALIIDGKLVSVPTIQSVIGKSGRITGKFTKAEAERIAHGLNGAK